MNEITIKINEIKNKTDLRMNPINVTDGEGESIGQIFIGLSSGNIFIENFKTNKKYTISPENLWGGIFPD